MRMPSQPLASQMKLGAAAHATSRTLAAWKRQVRVAPVPAGSSAGVPTSLGAMMWMVVSEPHGEREPAPLLGGQDLRGVAAGRRCPSRCSRPAR